MSKVTITKSKLDNLANAVSAKSGEPVLLTVDEMTDAVLGINTGEENVLEGVKVNGRELPIVDKKVNIPVVSETQAGVMTPQLINDINDYIDYVEGEIPTNVSDLTNDAGYISTETDPTVPSWAKQSTKPTYTASEVGALPDTTVIPEDKVFIATYGSTTYADTLAAYNAGKLIFGVEGSNSADGKIIIPLTRKTDSEFQFEGKYLAGRTGRLVLSLTSSGWTETSYMGDVIGRSETIASGDRIIFADSSNLFNSKYSTLAFGTSTSQYLANDGTWQTIPSWALESTKPTYTATEVGAVATSSVGAANGVAPLNASSKIDETYLPSYVDDVVEGYLYNGSFYKESTHTTVIPGEAGKIYVDLATDKTYRYGGSTFAEISSGTTVSVSRDLTSGTKVGTITVNGTGTDLYAPTPPTAVSQLTNDSGYITGYTETDPVYSASAAAGITSSDITNWNGKATCHYVTVTKSGETLSADATYQQIATWISNNDIVIVVYEGNNYYYTGLYNQTYYFDNSAGPYIAISSNDISRDEQYYAIGDLSEYIQNEYYDDGRNAIILNDGEDGSHFIRERYSDNTRAEIFLGNSSYSHTSSIELTADDIDFYTDRLYISNNNYTPTQDNDVTTKEYVDDSISSISIPTKTSDLTNDSGYITTETDPTVPSWAKASTKPSYSLSEISGTDDLQSIEGISGNSGLLKKTAANTWSLDTNTYLTSYTETDPVFTASPAAGITSTDITNWNDKSGKVKQTSSTANVDIPILLRDNKDASAAAAYDQTRFASVVTVHPSTGNLKATTFNDYTLAAACAKSVDSSISASSSSTNLPTSAAVASFVENKGYLTLATLPIYDGTVV